MQEYKIVEFGSLNDIQKEQAIDIIIEGFGHMMTFTKDKMILKELFRKGFHTSLFLCYVEAEKVLGIMGLGTNRVRPLKFDYDICVSLFGKRKGTILCKQMNAIFQSPVVKGDKELYIDILATAGYARGKGVATKLINYAFSLYQYETCYIEVFSKNETALRLYCKAGFSKYREKKFSPMIFLGSGYPILMKMDFSLQEEKK